MTDKGGESGHRDVEVKCEVSPHTRKSRFSSMILSEVLRLLENKDKEFFFPVLQH